MVSVRMSLRCAVLQCGPQPWPAQARKHPAVAGRAPQAASESKPFVILNEVDRRTQRTQKPLADSAEQGGERQTKCSQESVYVYFYIDSLSILRSPQNDNAVFALNHFLSGTHSSARPGRLRGSRFQREPAPGARPKTLASALPHQRNSRNVGHACHNCHSERSEESILGKVTDVSLRST